MKYIYANWKMYLDSEESIILAKEIFKKDLNKKKIKLAIFPSFLAIKDILKLKNSTKGRSNLVGKDIKIGAQNFDFHEKGAYTGEVSIKELKKIGCKLALVGHSERRYIFGEDEKKIKLKFKACLDNKITPVLCIGETATEKRNKKTKQVLKKQLKNVLDTEVQVATFEEKKKKFILAYEPVWAIGSGQACNPEKANEIITFLKKEVSKYTKNKVVILYGGSVDHKNINDYLQYKNIDGVLVGSASSKKNDFIKIIDKVSKL